MNIEALNLRRTIARAPTERLSVYDKRLLTDLLDKAIAAERLVEQGKDGTWGLTDRGARVLNAAGTHDGEVAVIDLLHALAEEEQS